MGLRPISWRKFKPLKDDSSEITVSDNGFGLENVNKRIKLYYGKQYGISIQSQYQSGTRVTL